MKCNYLQTPLAGPNVYIPPQHRLSSTAAGDSAAQPITTAHDTHNHWPADLSLRGTEAGGQSAGDPPRRQSRLPAGAADQTLPGLHRGHRHTSPHSGDHRAEDLGLGGEPRGGAVLQGQVPAVGSQTEGRDWTERDAQSSFLQFRPEAESWHEDVLGGLPGGAGSQGAPQLRQSSCCRHSKEGPGGVLLPWDWFLSTGAASTVCPSVPCLGPGAVQQAGAAGVGHQSTGPAATRPLGNSPSAIQLYTTLAYKRRPSRSATNISMILTR